MIDSSSRDQELPSNLLILSSEIQIFRFTYMLLNVFQQAASAVVTSARQNGEIHCLRGASLNKEAQIMDFVSTIGH